MPVDIIEMRWGCKTCNAENLGRTKICKNCGHPRTLDSPEWMPGDTSPMAAVKDPELLEKFEAGEDWKCKYCESSQFKADGTCNNCGASQTMCEDSERRFLGRSGVTKPPAPEVVQAASVTEGGYRASPRVRKTPALNPLDQIVEDEADAAALRRSTRPNTRTLLIGAGITVVVGLILYLVFRTKVVDTQVTALHWERAVQIDRYQVWSREGWNPESGSFNVHDEGSRIHHYDHVRTGSHTEHYTEKIVCGEDCTTIRGSCRTTPRDCRSNKNGSATCTGGDRVCDPDTRSCTKKWCDDPRTKTVDDYEDQPRYQEWWSWSIWDWGPNRAVPASGNTTDVAWPSEDQIRLGVGLKEGEKERESGRTESFQVTFSGSGDEFKFTPKSESEFRRFPVGTRRRIKVGVAHGVEVLP